VHNGHNGHNQKTLDHGPPEVALITVVRKCMFALTTLPHTASCDSKLILQEKSPEKTPPNLKLILKKLIL
jgi:hypothetical protein